jgi:hypothetical protein
MKVNTHCVSKMKQIYHKSETWKCIIEAMEWAIEEQKRSYIRECAWKETESDVVLR